MADTLEITAVLDLSGFNASLGILNAGLRGVGNLVKEIGIGAARYVGELGVRAFQRAGQAAFNFAQDVAKAAFENSALAKTFNEVYSGIVEITRTSFAPLVNELNSIVRQAAPAFLGIVQRGGEWLNKLATDALGYGEAISANFAQGIWDGFSYVVQALTDLGSLIAFWLAPGSPPRILPELDQWGTDAMNVYLGGWAKADFSIFNQLAAPLTAFIRSLADPLGKGEGVIPQILGTREGIAAAVSELRTTGQVAASTIDKIVALVGSSDAAVRSYIESTIALQAANQDAAAAQKQLNDASAAYAALLKPIDATLGRITEEQQQFTEEQEKGRLALTLKDPNATAAEKRQAALRIEQIDAERARRATVASGEAAVDAAQAQLDAATVAQVAAQAAVDTDSDRLKLLTEQNELLNSQIKLLDRLAEAVGAAASGGAKGGGGGGGGKFKIDTSWIDDLVEKVQGKLGALQEAWANAWAAMRAAMQPLVDFARGQFETALATVWTNIQTGLKALEVFWDRHHKFIQYGLELAWRVIVTTVTGAFTLLSGIFTAGMQLINGDWRGAWETVKLTLRSFMDQALAIVNQDWPTFQSTWANNFQMLSDILVASLQSMSDYLNDWLNTTSANMLTTWGGIFNNLKTIAVTAIAEAIAAVLSLLSLINSPLGGGGGAAAPSAYIPPGGSGGNSYSTNYYGGTQNVNVTSSQSAPSIVQDLAVANVWAQ